VEGISLTAPARRGHQFAVSLGSVAAVLTLLLGAGTAGAGERAGAARALNVTDTGRLHVISTSGSSVLEEGAATGRLPGSVRVRLEVAALVTASFTIYARGGTLSGHGSGALHSAGLYATFGGTMTVTRGTGRYAHAHGHGGFYGAINRRTFAVTVQTTGMLSY
jgi:hypothetical protein